MGVITLVLTVLLTESFSYHTCKFLLSTESPDKYINIMLYKLNLELISVVSFTLTDMVRSKAVIPSPQTFCTVHTGILVLPM